MKLRKASETAATRRPPARPVPPPEPAVAAPQEPWTVGVWGGIPQYRCRECAYDSTDITAIRHHVRLAHGR